MRSMVLVVTDKVRSSARGKMHGKLGNCRRVLWSHQRQFLLWWSMGLWSIIRPLSVECVCGDGRRCLTGYWPKTGLKVGKTPPRSGDIAGGDRDHGEGQGWSQNLSRGEGSQSRWSLRQHRKNASKSNSIGGNLVNKTLSLAVTAEVLMLVEGQGRLSSIRWPRWCWSSCWRVAEISSKVAKSVGRARGRKTPNMWEKSLKINGWKLGLKWPNQIFPCSTI